MPSLTLKNLPEDIHAQIKSSAQENQRSLTQETIRLINIGLGKEKKLPFHKWPVEERTAFIRANIVTPTRPLTHEEVMEGKNEGRA